MFTHTKIGRGIALLAATFSLSFGTIAGAQTTQHHGFLHRHAGAVAGIGAYEAAKHTGRRRIAHGRHRNFMQRHPIVTGIAAGAAAHHWAKKH
jgi:hypothetical protein